MKVLIINLRIGTGSVGRIVSDLYHGIIASGNECKIAYARGEIGDIPKKNTYKICSDYEVKIHAGLTRLLGNTAFYFSNSTAKFCEWIDKFKPDIVHIHGVYGYYLNMGTLFEYIGKKNIHLVSTLHSCWDFTGHCCYFDYSKCNQWKTGCFSCNQKKSYPSSSFLDNTHKNYTKKLKAYNRVKKCEIVTPSVWMSKLVSESFLKNKHTTVIRNGIDLDSFKPCIKRSAYVHNQNKPIILCVASIWDKRKGWDDVVELSYIINNRFNLVVVGVTDKQKAMLKKGTICINRTNSKIELAELYSNATVFFNPTYEDNYPTVNIESIACHTPVVTYNTGGSPEVLNNGKWGIVIPYKDYDSLCDYADNVFSKKLSFDFSSIESLSNYTMVKEYLKLYKRLLES